MIRCTRFRVSSIHPLTATSHQVKLSIGDISEDDMKLLILFLLALAAAVPAAECLAEGANDEPTVLVLDRRPGGCGPRGYVYQVDGHRASLPDLLDVLGHAFLRRRDGRTIGPRPALYVLVPADRLTFDT